MSAPKILATACALSLAGCAAGPIAAPLRYESAPMAREEAFRATPPAYTGDSLEASWHAETRVLANGLRVVVVPRHAAPIVSVHLVFARGAVDDPSLDPNVTAFLASAMLHASEAGVRGWEDRFAAIGAMVGTHADVDGADFQAFAQSARFEAMLAILATMTTAPALSERPVARLRNQWRDDYAARTLFPALDNSSALVVFGGAHPYGQPMTHTDGAKLASLTVSELTARYRALAHPAHATLIVVGDVETSRAMTIAESAFGAWHRDDPPLAIAHPEVTQGRANPVIHVDGRLAQSFVSIAASGPRPTSPEDWIPMQAAALILGGLRSSEVHRELRQEHGLTYSFGARLDAHREGSRFVMQGGFLPQDVPSSMTRMYRAIAALRDDPTPAAEVAKARATLIADWREDTESTSRLATLLARAAREHAPIDDVASFPARLNALRAEDIQRVARTYLRESQLHAVIGGSVDERALAKAGFASVERRTTEGLLRIEGQ